MLSPGFSLKCDFGLSDAFDTTLLYLCYFLVLPQDEIAFKKNQERVNNVMCVCLIMQGNAHEM